MGDAVTINRLRTIAAVSAFVSLIPAPSWAHSLADLYQLAGENDLTLQTAMHQRDASLEVAPRARAALFPQVAAVGYGRYNKLQVYSVNGGSVLDLANQRSESYTSTGYSVTLSQTIFDWSAIEGLSVADKQVAQAQATYASAQQNLTVRLATAYFGVLSAEDTLQADLDARAAFKQQLDQMQSQFRSGVAPVTDVKNAQAAYDLSTATVLTDTTALNNAKRALGVIVGRPVEKLDPLREEISLVPPSPSSVDSWCATAARDNPDVVTAHYAAQAAEQLISASRAKHLPTINAVGSVARDSSKSVFGEDAMRDYVGVSLNLPIFQGGLVSSSVRQAEASSLAALSQYELQLRATDMNVRNHYAGIVDGIATINAAASALASQQSSVIATEVGYKVGIRTVIDVLNARQALASAQKTFSLARYQYLISLLSLKSDVGQLSRRDIDDIDGLLVRSR